MDRLKSIEIFVGIVETGSLSAAAEQSGLSRSMASRHLQELEARLGVRLVNRTTRRLALTAPGRLFFDRCRTLLDGLAEAEGEVSAAGLEPRGRLRISAPMTFGTLYLAPLMKAFLDAHPKVEIDLVLNDRFVDLVDEGFDVAIRIGDLADSSLVARKLAACRMLAAASPAYLANRPPPRRPADLTDHECLCYAYAPNGDTWRFSGPDGVETVKIGGRLTANNGEALVAAAAAGQGIVIVPDFILAPWIVRRELVPILRDHEVIRSGIWAVFTEGRRVSAKVRSFVTFLSETWRPKPSWEAAIETALAEIDEEPGVPAITAAGEGCDSQHSAGGGDELASDSSTMPPN